MDLERYRARDERANSLLNAKQEGLADMIDDQVDSDPRVQTSLTSIRKERNNNPELAARHRDLLDAVKRELAHSAGVDLVALEDEAAG